MDEKIKKAIFIVVIFVFGILALNFILNIFTPWYYPSDDPYENSENLLKAMDATPYKEKVSSRFYFAKEDTINSAALADEILLEKNQVCLSIEEDLTGFEVQENSLISYSRDSDARVQLAGICGPKDEFVSENLIENYAPVISSRGFDFFSSGCASTCLDSQRCCVLFLFDSE